MKTNRTLLAYVDIPRYLHEHGAQTIPELIAKLGYSEGVTRKAMRKLRENGLIQPTTYQAAGHVTYYDNTHDLDKE